MSEDDKRGTVVSFGKYKGLTVPELLDRDPAYADWLMGQGWVAAKFAELHAAIAAKGSVSEDTPEHNALQAKFLDPLFRVACVRAARLPRIQSMWKEEREYEERSEAKRGNNPPRQIYISTIAVFERAGVDVTIDWAFGYGTFYFGSYAATLSETAKINIELKPSIGDDYPSVMRQMQRLNCRICLIERYTGASVPESDVRQMFKLSGYALIDLADVQEELRMMGQGARTPVWLGDVHRL